MGLHSYFDIFILFCFSVGTTVLFSVRWLLFVSGGACDMGAHAGHWRGFQTTRHKNFQIVFRKLPNHWRFLSFPKQVTNSDTSRPLYFSITTIGSNQFRSATNITCEVLVCTNRNMLQSFCGGDSLEN